MPKENVKYITSLKELRVINDPYRREILTAMSFIDKPATAKDIASFMDEPPSKVNYHVKILHKYGFIDFHHNKNINGIIANFYVKSTAIVKIVMEGKDSKTKEMTALSDIVSSTFDIARDRYISTLIKSVDEQDKGNCEKTNVPKEKQLEEELLFSKKVYLSEEEVIKLNDFVNKIVKNKPEGRKLYDFFASTIPIKDYKK